MFATAEEKIIVACLTTLIMLVGIAGYTWHERREGASVCVQQDHTAAIAQAKKETVDARASVADLRAQLSAVSAAAPGTPAPLRLCITTRRVPTVGAARRVESLTLPDSGTGPGVQTGTESGVDIGPGVQDIALSGVLGIADAAELWALAIKESNASGEAK